MQLNYKAELSRLINFCLVGGFGFIVHVGMVFVLTHFFSINTILAWFPAFIVAVMLTWLFNHVLTFKGMGQHSTRGEVIWYCVIQSFGATINFCLYASLIFSKAPILSYPLMALSCGAAAAFVFNYISLRYLVFRFKPNPDISKDDTANSAGGMQTKL